MEEDLGEDGDLEDATDEGCMGWSCIQTTCSPFTTNIFKSQLMLLLDHSVIHYSRVSLFKYNNLVCFNKYCFQRAFLGSPMASNQEGTEASLQVVEEGSAKIFQPKTVFYNKAQEFNRDLR